jgi:hypothetical protein
MSSDFTSQRPMSEVIHGDDDGPLMVAKVIRGGEPIRWMYLWPVEPPALLRTFEDVHHRRHERTRKKSSIVGLSQ